MVQNSGGGVKLKIDDYSEVCYPVISVVRAGISEDEILTPRGVQLGEVISLPSALQVDTTDDVMRLDEPAPLNGVVQKLNVDRPKRRARGWKMWRLRLSGLIVGAVALIATVLVGLRLAGFRTFTVMSGSMSPEYPVGALIYVQPVDYTDLKVGDVISYVANDDKTVVTHRIVEIVPDEADASVIRFRTQGDANEAADGKLVHYKNVLGTPIITIPNIGYIVHNIQQPPGVYIALVVGTLLLAWTFLPGTLEERRKTASKSVA